MRCLHVFNYFEMEERFFLFKRKRLQGQVLLQFFHIFLLIYCINLFLPSHVAAAILTAVPALMTGSRETDELRAAGARLIPTATTTTTDNSTFSRPRIADTARSEDGQNCQKY